MSLPITEMLIAPNHPNRPGTKLYDLRAIVIHYTANTDKGAGAKATARYFGRKFVKGSDGKIYESDGKTEFRYASAHIACDDSNVYIAIPPDEVGWSVGDRRLTWTQEFKGQNPVATYALSGNANYHTFSIEICNNSDSDWGKAVAMAKDWVVEFMKAHNLTVNLDYSMKPQEKGPVIGQNKILLLRHYDVSGKVCPKPMVDSQESWEGLIKDVYNRTQPVVDVGRGL